MHLVDESDAQPLRSIDDLLGYFRAGEKPASAWRMGSEHELIGVITDDPAAGAPAYQGNAGIARVLDGFEAAGWKPVREGGHVIALTSERGQITLEPGGQFELASRPVADDRQFSSDLDDYLARLAEVSRALGITWLSSGFRPFGGRGDVPWMPKQRYEVMRAYMPQVGSRGLDMMLRTATVQTNLDYSDEADAAAKLRCLFGVTSILTAIYANSPLVAGQPSGFQSYRAYIWRDTDPARCGLLRLAFERDDVYRAYTEWALDVPMYFVYRGGYRAVSDLTFRRFLRDGWQGEHAVAADWALHLSTLFPEARLKQFIEVRGCDCGSVGTIKALAPLCRGLLYDRQALAAATALTAGWSWAQRIELADAVPRHGFAAKVAGRTVGDLAAELMTIARAGLARCAPTALPLLAPLDEIVGSRRTQADRTLDAWKQAGGDPQKLARLLAHPGLGE